MTRLNIVLFGLLCWSSCTAAAPRTWTSKTGGFEMTAELVAFNDTTVILKRGGAGRLAAVELAELSDEDQAFVKETAKGDGEDSSDKQMHTWTSKEGVQFRAKLLAYGRKDFTLTRTRGVATINGKAFTRMDELHQKIALRVLSELEDASFVNAADLNHFVGQLGGRQKTYPLEGVLMELPAGDQIAVPFFLFGENDLEVLQAGWENWLKANDDQAARDREDLMVQSHANYYQQIKSQADQAYDAQQHQMEILKLNMLATATGLTSIWEVGLRPGPGFYGRPTTVLVTARNSDLATQMVLPNYPGYVVFGVRRASR